MKTKENVKDIYSLSPMQEGMLFHYLYNRDSSVYFEQLMISLEGVVDISYLEKSFNLLINKYDVFRTVFSSNNTVKPRQIVLKKRTATITYFDLSDKPKADLQAAIEEIKHNDRQTGFDLLNDMLIRMGVLKTAENQYHIMISFHHILIDGWCFSTILNDLFSVYGALISGVNESDLLTREKYPFSNYIKWLEKQDESVPSEFWKNYLHGYNEQATFRSFERDGTAGEYKNGASEFIISHDLTNSIKQLVTSIGITQSTFFQTAWGILLQKYNNNHDVVFGSVVSGRPSELQGVNDIMGLFINTIPVRVKNASTSIFSDIAKSVQSNLLDSKSFEYYPLSEIQKLGALKNNLFDNLLVFENFSYGDAKQFERFSELGFKILNTEVFEQTNYDLNCILYPSDSIRVLFNYNTNKYKQDFVERLYGHFLNLITEVLKNPSVKIEDINIMSEAEIAQIHSQFNNTSVPYPNKKSIHELFLGQVMATPEKLAIKSADIELSYEQLNRLANKLAENICALNPKENKPVVVFLERSIEFVVGALAILKSGQAYLPVDPNYPDERVSYLFEDSSADIVLTLSKYKEKIKNDSHVIFLDELESLQGANNENERVVDANAVAYVMYTSGSTGKPKGTMVSHKNVVRLVKNTNYVPLNENTRILQTASSVFDVSTFEIWGSLLNGGTLYLVPDSTITNIKEFEVAIKAYGINTLWLTAPLFNQLIDQDANMFGSLEYLLVGGDVLSPSHINKVRALFPDLTVINGYGPTENTTFSTTFIVDKEYKESIPIGGPIPNSTIYILDQNEKLQPIGAIGEIYVGGDGVALGYYNNEQLTQERFVKLEHIAHGTLYKTGDLGRWLPEGDIEFLGRNDFQVKIRGYRIELGEIEEALRKCKKVKNAYVMTVASPGGEKSVCAYVVPKVIGSIDVSELRKDLGLVLPAYMIPSFINVIEDIPLTINGKVDREALPLPVGVRAEYEAPRNQVELQIAQVLQEVLGIDKVGINDNYFDLGGDSIHAMPVSSRLKKAGIDLDVRDLFQHQTINEISSFLKMKESKSIDNSSEQVSMHSVQDIDSEVGALLNYIELAQLRFKERLLSSPVVRTFSLTGVQKGHLAVEESTSGTSIVELPFSTLADKGLVISAIRCLLKEQTLLRSTVQEQDGNYNWQEHQEIDDFEVPFIDISNYNAETREQIQSLLIPLLEEKEFQFQDGLLYSFAVMKKGPTEHVLVLQTHHIYYDNMSLQLWTNQIVSNINQLKENVLPSSKGYRPYYQYVEQLELGPVGIGAHDLINKFDLHEFSFYQKKLEKALKEKEDHIDKISCLNYRINLDDLDKERIFDISYYAFAILLKRYFNLPKIPVNVFSYGRNYQNKKYFNTIGEFLDLIPVVIDFDEDNSRLGDYVNDRLRFVENHNINFAALQSSPKFHSIWGEACDLFATSRENGRLYTLSLDFQSERSREEIEVFEKWVDERVTRLGTAQNTFMSLMCEVKYCNDFILLTISTKFEDDMDVFRAILDDEQKNFAKLFGVKSLAL